MLDDISLYWLTDIRSFGCPDLLGRPLQQFQRRQHSRSPRRRVGVPRRDLPGATELGRALLPPAGSSTSTRADAAATFAAWEQPDLFHGRNSARPSGRSALTNSSISKERAYDLNPRTVLYTGKVRTVGGRDGVSRSSDGRLDVKLSPPGSPGSGTNPEQLFAAGWSACFEGAMGSCGPQAMKIALAG